METKSQLKSTKHAATAKARQKHGGSKFEKVAPHPAPNGGLSDRRAHELFKASLSRPLLGHDICLDVYLRNGFRCLGLPANAHAEAVSKESGRVRSLAKISPAAVSKILIKTGYDHYLSPEDVVDSATRLKDPRFRLLCELFWPHLPDDAFAKIKEASTLEKADLPAALSSLRPGTNGQERILTKHALAIIYHNLAVRDEIGFLNGEAEWQDTYWRLALSHWAEVLSSDHFWAYFRERVASYDDFRVRMEDLADLRQSLPLIIMQFNGAMARLHIEDYPAVCNRHLHLLGESAFRKEDVKLVLSGTIASVSNKKLTPLTQRAATELVRASKKLKWQDFREKASPILDEARSLLCFLSRDLQLSQTEIGYAQFDEFCGTVLEALDKSIDYGHERERAVLFNMATIKLLLSMPVSTDMRRKMEVSLRQSRQALYKDFDLPETVDPTECWFLPGEPASPEASILKPVYKITTLTGVQIGWSSRVVLVPRSALAEDIHRGRHPKAGPQSRQKSAAAMAVQDQMEQERSRCQSEAESLRVQKKDVRRKAAQKHKAKYHQLSAEVKQEEQSVAPTVRAIQSAQKKAEAKGRSLLDAAVSQSEAKYRAKLAEAEKQLEQITQACRQGMRILTVDLPLLAVGAGVGGAIAYCLGLGLAVPQVLAGAPGIGTGAGIGAVLGLVLSQFIKRRPIARQRGVIRRIAKAMKSQTDRLTREAEEKIEAIRGQAKKRLAQTRACLTKLQKALAEYVARIKAEVQGEEDRIEAEIRAVQDTSEKAIKKLEAKLVAFLEPKAERMAGSFPAYEKAKSTGYKDGEKPSESEAQSLMQTEFNKFRDSLEAWEAMLLQRIVDSLDANQRTAFLTRVMGMSNYERQKLLRGVL